MKKENRFYDVWPKVVPADANSTIRIKDRFNQSMLKNDTEYEVFYYPCERFSQHGEYKYQEKKILKAVGGILEFEQFFKGEQEHILVIQEKGNEDVNKRVRFKIYSLNKDLYDRKPYKGDMHMHTHYSDGKESPGFVTASCRKIGLDFMAITDHGLYDPSIKAQECFKDVELDMLVCRGEEVHPVNNPVHMINFGGSFSVNDAIRNNEKKYYEEIGEIQKGLGGIADEDARYQCASCMWVFDKIREGGGLGIFCHPYWLVNWIDEEGYYISDTVISYMFEKQPYDAYEVIGGYPKDQEESNTLQVARYHEERAKGRNIPIVGVSDAHGCEDSDLFGWYYTIAFSPSLEQGEITSSIKDSYSVAVEAIPGEAIRAYGPFRLVKYAMFLMREVLPEHDELCREEGQLMMAHLTGDEGAAEKLKALKGRTEKLYKKLWA